MANFALPPSSPLYDEAHSDFDDDNQLLSKKFPTAPFIENEHYPTPNPSSVRDNIGSSSPQRLSSSPKRVENGPLLAEFSPVKSVNYENDNDHYIDLQDGSKKLRKPRISSQRKMKKIKVSQDGSEITFGRSKFCDVVITDSENLASRKHASVHYDKTDNVLVFKCYGVNSLEIFIPFNAKVKQLGGIDRFELIPKDTESYHKLKDLRYEELVTLGLTKFSRSLEYQDGGVKIMVLNNEALRVPKSTVVMDIRGACCVIELEDNNDPDLTDDEEVKINDVNENNNNNNNSNNNVILYKVGDQIESFTSMKSSKDEDSKPAPLNSIIENPMTPNAPTNNRVIHYNSSPIALKDNILKPSKTNKLNSISLDKVKELINEEPSKKRTLSSNTSTQVTKKQKLGYDYQDPKTLIDEVNKDEIKKQQSLLEVEDLDDIKKIVINHLAFSRIASTPLTQLNTVSKKLENLNKKSLRLVLSDIRCVGVIYRKGKDAAGKPLDEEYYYDIERDEDDGRKTMVNSVKGGSSLRSCRKTHKQYYWKRPPPLPRY